MGWEEAGKGELLQFIKREIARGRFVEEDRYDK
jgi:hypothetical protein